MLSDMTIFIAAAVSIVEVNPSNTWKIADVEKCRDSLACIYLLKVNGRNTRTRCEIYSELRST